VAALFGAESSKTPFDGGVARSEARFELKEGAAHALYGGDGADNSTFVSTLSGIGRRVRS
jgi:ABC-type sugar transport system ATPase subunit